MVVQVTAAGVRLGDPVVREQARRDFAQRHLIRLPDFVGATLRDRLASILEGTPWRPRTLSADGAAWAVDFTTADPAVSGLLMFLLNDPSLFAEVERLTACDRIACFLPNIYKMLPGGDNHDDWHTDVDGERLVALSINLGPEPFEGGLLRVRRKASGEPIHELHNSRFGDALLLRIAPELQHCVMPVAGTVPRIAAAGWFQRSPDYRALLRRRR